MPHHSRGGARVALQLHEQNNANANNDVYHETIENHEPNVTRCCVPSSGCLSPDEPTIRLDDLSDAVKVLCNNEGCDQGSFMHRACFDDWEQGVLTYLRSTGRARSWSEKQRLQNLWTKKGYDLAFKACGCKCAKGHLRKDLDWIPPKSKAGGNNNNAANRGGGAGNGGTGAGGAACGSADKKKSRKKKNDKPALGGVGGCGGGGVASASMPVALALRDGRPMLRIRTNSLSSTGSSPPNSSSAESPSSPQLYGGSSARLRRNNSKFDFFSSDRVSSSSAAAAAASIFSKRMDFSSFNSLPRHKINSYHIKMEDDGNHGNDDTRCFILSSLAGAKTSKIGCILCHNTMNVFDRYPLVDGTFFLSPRQHSKTCIPVKLDGRPQYLCAVCMSCLEGSPSCSPLLRCRYCHRHWDGSHLILGTMYSYDIFAATPCCADRLRCNNCHRALVHDVVQVQQSPCGGGASLVNSLMLPFSHYSHSVACPSCRVIDFHFVKSLSTYNRANRIGD